jgi:hypothetical protein
MATLTREQTDWARYADPQCRECFGSGEMPTRDRTSFPVTVLCHCAEKWRALINDSSELRAKALEEFLNGKPSSVSFRQVAPIALVTITILIFLLRSSR